MRSPHLPLAHSLWKGLLHPGDLAVDATCGNGHDTLALATLGAEVIGLDIQPEALTQTRLRLGSRPATLLLHSHAPFPPLPRAPRLVVYNLGYLPGGDKSRTTQTETTLASVQEAYSLLAPDGALSITCYPGHPEGAREEAALMAWAAPLNGEHFRWPERVRSPSLLWIAKTAAPRP